jgi:sugar lactone lactonase YvrE
MVMNDYKLEVIYFDNSELLESCEIDNINNLLYFVSIHKQLVYCYDIKSGEIHSMKTNGPVGCVRIKNFKKVIIADISGIYEMDFSIFSIRKIDDFVDEENVRFNDGLIDPKGRFLIGTMGYPDVINGVGKLYSYFDGLYKILINNVTISNGIAISDDATKLFYIDTPTKKVVKYKYDINSGVISEKSELIEFTNDSYPDGMCIDINDNLYIAEWGGGAISKWNSDDGKLIEKYNLPVINITSCAIDKDKNLYITTAKSEKKDEQFGGALFYLKFKS